MIEHLAAERLTRAEILLTHHHPVAEVECVAIPELGVDLAALDIPGHTRAHNVYYGANSGAASHLQ